MAHSLDPRRSLPRPWTSGAALAALVLLLGYGLTGPRASAESSESDAKAIAVADRVMETLGGQEAWQATRYLRFDFAVDREGKTLARRAHTWDRRTGRYRVEATDEEGRPVVVLMNLSTKEGKAWVGGEPASGEALDGLLESGFAWWTNDTYWLLMPYKMRDDGVVLTYAGIEAGQSGTWEKVLLTFEDVGLTPKDKYWVFVNKKTGLVDRWEFVLKGADTPPVPWNWSGWKTYGAIQLADDRVNPNDGTRIYFPVLDVPSSVPDAVFSQP
ncbi:MAG: hypothetical protein LJF30_15400 [Acidobacteria bacterium]|jgi:hypothetical protein|nr:hypothetical protein [Acidobacteriota bacterium]